MINNNEIIYKMEIKNNDGYNYELYNRLCPGIGGPDSILLNMQKMFYI